MAYQAPIQRTGPTAFLFLVDQSASMADPMANSDKAKARFVADLSPTARTSTLRPSGVNSAHISVAKLPRSKAACLDQDNDSKAGQKR